MRRRLWLAMAAMMIAGWGALMAQNTLRINYSDGTTQDVPLSAVDSLTFVETAADAPEAVLQGSWLWGGQAQGYYELLTFLTDYTYTGYDNYFTYGFDTQTYGFYSQYGTMLTLWSSGYGYNWRYNWMLTMLTDNALTVVTRNGPFTYYRLQPEPLHLQLGGAPLACGEGDEIVFADGVVVKAEGAQLLPLAPGTTYILKRDGPTGKIWGYKVIVG